MAPFFWESSFPVPVSDLFAWHERKGAFDRLNPPWRPVRVVNESKSIRDGERIQIELSAGFIKIPWTLEHELYVANEQFADTQITGPFKSWHHVHKFLSGGDTQSTLRDEINFELPGSFPFGFSFVGSELRRLFTFRHSILKADLELHRKWKGEKRLRVLLSGSSGMIGKALKAFLTTAGHEVLALVRRKTAGEDERYWNPDQGELESLPDVDAVIHLGGDNITSGRWTEEKKKKIRASRVDSTKLLSDRIANSSNKPKVFIVASAVGIYGDTGNDTVDESHPPGFDFLADVSKAWEQSCSSARDSGIRVVNMRFGIVLNPFGGVLQKILPSFRLGGGAALGSGDQFMSWIALQDVLGAIEHCLHDNSISGPVNAVAPNPVKNREFTRTLAKVLHRPSLFSIPSVFLKAAFGEIANAALLQSVRVEPTVLKKHGYIFKFPMLEDALRFECGV